MKMRKILILAVAILSLTGCGESTSVEETGTDTERTEVVGTGVTEDATVSEELTVQGEGEYIGTFGKEVFFTGIDDYVGCEFNITMIYEAKDADGYYVFNAVEKTSEGSMAGLFRVADKTEDKLLAETANYSSLDNLAVEMRVVLDRVVIYEDESSGQISLEYEVTAKEATFLPLDSVEAKLARSGYFVAGNTITFKSGMSVHIIDVGYSTYLVDSNCVYIEVEITNTGEEDISLPDLDFYGDDYVLDRAYLGEDDIVRGASLSPGRKVHGYYAAVASKGSYSLIEAEIGNAIILVDYSEGASSTVEKYGLYTYDNGVDAVIEGDVGIYTDTEENYIYLAALYYGSNHYSAEIQGTLQQISENTFSVKDEITGTVELEVTFVDGGMDVKVTATESDEYKVLEGHYHMN